MDDRYEIRGKIGQGGIGAVYRAYDKNLSREVAIKRILPEGGTNLEKEANRQLTKEAGALAALQHPHIVTIYDVGIDDDGPFVVMELLQGKTIDEVVENAIFTWQDFREFAMQTQEALIAAQDMNLLHRDLKPTNVMLTWLPSGKFQVKIVDFGLAKFSPKPSLQTIDQKDSIFGSIFFMSPEQFERTELDIRTDMYSIGCLYYYALTGVHPFNGETGPQVMIAHLEHRVFPLHEIRPDLPRWVTDWVMWHINRLADHRPNNARESLAHFIQSDQTMLLNAYRTEVPAESQAATTLIRPGAPVGLNTPAANPAIAALIKTAPQPILPPENFGRPSVHTVALSNMLQAGEFAAAPNAPSPAAIVTPTTAPTPLPVAPESEPPDLAAILKTAEPVAPEIAELPAVEPTAIASAIIQEVITPAIVAAVPVSEIETAGVSELLTTPAAPAKALPLVAQTENAPEGITSLAAAVQPETPPVAIATNLPAAIPDEAPAGHAIAHLLHATPSGPRPIVAPRPVATTRYSPGAPQTVPLNASPAMQTRPLVYHPGGPPGEMPQTPEKKKIITGAKVGLALVVALVLIVLAVLLLSKYTPMKDLLPGLYNSVFHRLLK